MRVIIVIFIFIACAVSTPAQIPNASPTPNSSLDAALTSPQVTPSPAVSAPVTEARVTIEKPVSEGETPRYASKEGAARISRFETAPVIDGQLNDPIWSEAVMFGDFLQTNPGDNIAPTHPTEVMMGYDAKNLYIAFRVIQDKDKVRATVARRDNIFNDDYIGVYLDTFNDQRQAYTIFFNPLGIQADGVYTEGRGEDYNVDLVMESKGVLTENGYTIEVAIPFKSLRYEAGKNKQWGIHIFRRVKYKENELDSWMRNDRSRSGSLNQAGHITGLEGIATTRQLEINPSFTLSQTGRRTRYTFDGNPAGRFVNSGLEAEFGMTAKFSLTPTITLDFAYNPDFAQVEADAPVSSANVRFPIFFAEKRPFFLERIDIFQTRMNIVNTRAIVDPDVAVKLTGRRGKNTFGLLYASDKAPGNYSLDERENLRHCQQNRLNNPNANILCGIERFVDKNADIGVLRIKRDIGRQHNLGFFATTYSFPENHNNTGGFDGRFRLSPKIVTEFQVVGTHSRRCFFNADFEPLLNPAQAQQNRNTCNGSLNEYRNGNGFGYSYRVERSDRNWFMSLGGTGRTSDYRAQVGFTPRTDTNQHVSFIQYQSERDAKKLIISKRLFNETGITHDWHGRTQGYSTNTQGMLAFQRQIYVGGGLQFGYERVFEHEFGANRTATRPTGAFFGNDSERSSPRKEIYSFIEATPLKQLFFFTVLSYSKGDLDYDFGAGPKYPRVSAPFLAYLEENDRRRQLGLPLIAEPGIDPGPGDQLYIESSVRYQPIAAWQAQINYTRTRLIRHDTGKVAFDDNVFSLRSTYQFTRDIFARLRLDYSNISTRFRPQLILGWTPSPGTALYVGYNDDLNYQGFNPYTGIHEPGFRGNGRTFFIKASYLFKKSF